MRLVLFFFLLLSNPQFWVDGQTQYPVKHVIVLMMENRSFDHFLGFMTKNVSGIDGLTGMESNPYNTSDPSSPVVVVNENGYDTGPDDPCHSFDCITEQVFGYAKPIDQSANTMMNGFVQNAIEVGHSKANPMSMFNSTKLPILYTLAQEFAVFDKWFCSAPTPTNPNRAFAMSGTSAGIIDNDIPTDGYPQETHFEQIAAEGKTWRIYYSDDPWAAGYFHNLRLPENVQYVVPIEEFWRDVKYGNLTDYVFLQPRMSTSPNGPSNWQHPDDSVREGERLYKEVYEALRVSKLWEDLVLVITYDEHGGFFDHVGPPQTNVPNPDGIKAENGFNFDRLGVRIPTVVISPWVNKGRIIHEPTGTSAPTPDSQYDATSIIATTNKILGVKNPNTNRTQWAGTFDFLLLERSTPRTDCPVHLPEIAPPDQLFLEASKKRRLTDHEETSIQVLCSMNRRDSSCGKEVKVAGDMYEFVTSEWKYYLDHIHTLTQPISEMN